MTLADRIENWRRWAIAKGSPYGQANSLEGDYRSPQHWHPEGPRGPEVWRADAELLEAAWKTVRPLESKAILRWWHINRMTPNRVCKRVRQIYGHAIQERLLPEEVAKADARFALAIEAMERVTRVHEHFLVKISA